jgi:hypothetical protein
MKSERALTVLKTVGLLLVLSWIAAAAIPFTREMMLDLAASFLLNLVVTALLWWASRQATGEEARFWRWLALGWTLNVAGNIAWSVHDLVTGRPIPIFSWLDVIYLARYAAILVGLSRFPRRWSLLRWLGWGVVFLGAVALIWLTLFRPTLPLSTTPWAHFLGGAFYPMVDAALLYAALLAWSDAGTRRLRWALGWFALAMFAYGAANWVNFSVRVMDLGAGALLAGLFWLLADLLTGLSASAGLAGTLVAERPAASRWPRVAPYGACALTFLMTLLDLLRLRRLDPALLIATLLSLGLLVAYHLLRERHPVRQPLME